MRKKTDFTSVEELAEYLGQAFKDQRWRRILAIFATLGLADTRQLKRATGLNADMVKRTLERLEEFWLNGQRLLTHSEELLKRPMEANRPPLIFMLAPGGANLLRYLGYSSAKECKLQDDAAIVHAVAMLWIHLVGQENAEIHITTDQPLHFGDEKELRPDHQVLELESGSHILMEMEQAVSTHHLPRMIESIANRQAFFQSLESHGFLKEVRMVVNIKAGKDFYKVLKVWKEAMRHVIQKSQQELSFSIKAIPITVFLKAPEWGEMLSERWETVTPKTDSNITRAHEMTGEMSLATRPERSLEADAVLLTALAQRFDENVSEQYRHPDWGMLSVVKAIYGASNGINHRYVEEIAGTPLTSVYLLRQYLALHPVLCSRLRQAIHMNRSKIVWSQQNILHRMRGVINTFLAYHGWRSSRILRVYPTIEGEGRGDYTVKCEFYTEIPGYDYPERERVKEALTWALLGLFEYADDIGLGRPEFW